MPLSIAACRTVLALLDRDLPAVDRERYSLHAVIISRCWRLRGALVFGVLVVRNDLEEPEGTRRNLGT
jgi:hypothetical protein